MPKFEQPPLPPEHQDQKEKWKEMLDRKGLPKPGVSTEELELGIREEKQNIEADEKKQISEAETRMREEKEKRDVLQELKEEPSPETIEISHRDERMGEILKTPEQLLSEARENFARINLNAEAQLKGFKNLGEKKSKLDIEGYKDILDEYKKALQNQRVDMYEKILIEIDRLELPEEKKQKLLRQKMEEIAKITIIQEANNLYDAKTRLSLEAKGDASFAQKAWKTAGRTVEWYRKLPLKYKLMVSGGFLAGGVVAGAAGGATGAALAAGVVTGRWFQRAFGGAATAVGIEGLIKRSQEKKAEKKTLKAFGDNLSELIKNNDKSLDERLMELEGKKKSEKTRRYILAGAAGTMVASGLLGRAIRWGVEETGIGKSIKETIKGLDLGKPSEVGKIPEYTGGKTPEGFILSHGPGYEPSAAMEYPAYEAPPGEEVPAYKAPSGEDVFVYEVPPGSPEIAAKGDSVWKIISRQLSDRYGEKFAGLDEARRTYIIDALKVRVVDDPEKFGLTDADKIQIGKEYDFLPGSNAEIDKMFEDASGLRQEQLENIIKTNQAIEEWVKSHPGEKIPDSDDILSGKGEELWEEHAPEGNAREEYVNEPAESVEGTGTNNEAEAAVESPKATEVPVETPPIEIPAFDAKIEEILGDAYSGYGNLKEYKVGDIFTSHSPQWQGITKVFASQDQIFESSEEIRNQFKSGGAKELLKRVKDIFMSIKGPRGPYEMRDALNLSLDDFLRKYFNKI